MSSLCRRKHSVYIQLTGLMSVVSLVTVCVSLGTQKWIDATAKPNSASNASASVSNINYGLFGGTLNRRLLSSPITYDIFFTCIWDKNACGWSCQSNTGLRKSEIRRLILGDTPNFSCLPAGSTKSYVPRVEFGKSKNFNNNRIFTNAGLWLTTIILLAILLLALLVSVILSIINSMKSPIETYFNIQGIYVANGIAMLANLLALILYGVCYDIYIKENIAIYDTIVGDYVSEAALGYSYWILLLPCPFHAVGIFLIAMRELMINSDRAETTIDVVADTPETGVLF